MSFLLKNTAKHHPLWWISFGQRTDREKGDICGGVSLVRRANGKNVVKMIFITALVKLIALKCESAKIGKNVVKMVFITALVKLFALSLQIRMNKS